MTITPITETGEDRAVVFLGDRFLSAHESPMVSLFDRGYMHGDAVLKPCGLTTGNPFAWAHTLTASLWAHLNSAFRAHLPGHE